MEVGGKLVNFKGRFEDDVCEVRIGMGEVLVVVVIAVVATAVVVVVVVDDGVDVVVVVVDGGGGVGGVNGAVAVAFCF